MANIASTGTPICSVLTPTGGGSTSLETIRDNVLPAPGSIDYTLQYDTYNAVVQTTAFYGYTWAAPVALIAVNFQNGGVFLDGGWFTSITVEALNGGSWTTTPGLVIAPAYPTTGTGLSYEQYLMTFTPITCDGIRVFGVPGGAGGFVSCGELQALTASTGIGPIALGNKQPVSRRSGLWLTGRRDLRG